MKLFIPLLALATLVSVSTSRWALPPNTLLKESDTYYVANVGGATGPTLSAVPEAASIAIREPEPGTTIY
ncbi:hypothetical protein AX16_007581 [Volvariella volvacea WC 439]|nr:hypothetical protein AX16_007581 [Volvariella volvacea WC 439]